MLCGLSFHQLASACAQLYLLLDQALGHRVAQFRLYSQVAVRGEGGFGAILLCSLVETVIGGSIPPFQPWSAPHTDISQTLHTHAPPLLRTSCEKPCSPPLLLATPAVSTHLAQTLSVPCSPPAAHSPHEVLWPAAQGTLGSPSLQISLPPQPRCSIFCSDSSPSPLYLVDFSCPGGRAGIFMWCACRCVHTHVETRGPYRVPSSITQHYFWRNLNQRIDQEVFEGRVCH